MYRIRVKKKLKFSPFGANVIFEIEKGLRRKLE
jgi:hypothetical protein